MKRTLLLSFASAIGVAALAQTQLINEGFESYSDGAPIASSSPTDWGVWPGGSPGGPADADVTAAQANNGSKSLGIIATTAAGGPTDLLLKLGNKTSGSYSLSFWVYIPSGKGGYFNVQTAENATPAQWALDVNFLGNGTVRADANNDTTTIGTYPFDTWFSVLLVVDMDAGDGSVIINSTAYATFDFSTQVNGDPCTQQLGAINFYAFAGGAPTVGEMYVDDVLYLQLPTSIEEVGGDGLSVFPNPATEQLYVDVPAAANNPVATLLDASGRTVAGSDLYTTIGEALRMEMDLRNVPVGVYTLRVSSGQAVPLTRKIVKH